VRLWAGLAIGLVVGAFAATTAAAQDTDESSNSLQSITPADAAALAESPSEIVLSFNQELADDDFADVELTCGGEEQDTGLGERDPDNLVVKFAIRHELPRSSCIIEWDLVDALGATIAEGTTTFRVDADPSGTVAATVTTVPGTTVPGELVHVTVPPITAATTATEGSSEGALWLGRLLSTLGIMIVFGALALISVGWPEGPEYIVTVRFLRTAWVVGLIGTVLYLIAFAADFTGKSFTSSLSPTTWLDLTDAGWPGRGALLRLVFVVASGAVAMRPERIIDPASAMWAWAVPGCAVASLALSRVDGSAALVGFVVGVLHVLGAAVWLGGAALVGRVVLAGPGDDDLVQATRTFSRISVPAIVLTCVTGLIQMLRLDGGELFSSGHGRVVLLKAIAVAVMIAVALAVRQQVGLRLDRAQELSAPMADRFRRAFGAEATLGIVVLAFSGWLLALTPPNSDPLAGEDYLPAIPFVDPATGLDVTVEIGPGRVGRNGFKVVVNSPETGLSNLTMRLKPPPGAPAEARFWIDQPLPITGVGTAYLDDSQGIPLLVAGTWTIELSGVTPTGGSAPMQFTFHVATADGSPVPTQPPVQPTSNVNITLVDTPTTDAAFATTTTTTIPPSLPTNPPAG